MPIPTTLLLTSLAALSSHSLYLSYYTITRLQKYEEQSEKAAEWSNTAAQRLRKTRTTQGSGAVTVGVSILSTLFLGLYASEVRYINVWLSVFNASACFAARQYMQNFWNSRNQTKVPFVQQFNEAISGSQQLIKVLSVLGAGWLGNAVVGWFRLRGVGAVLPWVGMAGVWGLQNR